MKICDMQAVHNINKKRKRKKSDTDTKTIQVVYWCCCWLCVTKVIIKRIKKKRTEKCKAMLGEKKIKK